MAGIKEEMERGGKGSGRRKGKAYNLHAQCSPSPDKHRFKCSSSYVAA